MNRKNKTIAQVIAFVVTSSAEEETMTKSSSHAIKHHIDAAVTIFLTPIFDKCAHVVGKAFRKTCFIHSSMTRYYVN